MSDIADISEAFKKLRETLLGDSTLAGLLGAVDSIYFAYSPVSVRQLPLLAFTLTGLNPQGQISKTGVYRPTFDVKIVGPDLFKLYDISGYLEANWTVPRERRPAINSDHFSITEISWGQAIQLPSGSLINTNTPVQGLSQELKLRVVRTS